MSVKRSRRSLLKKSVTLGLAVTALQGCRTLNDSDAIRMGVTSRPRMLDPRKATDALSSRVNRLIYRQLIDFNDRFEPVPDLANWTQLSEKTYQINLQQDSFFPDGSKLTADDVVATYRSILDPKTGSAHRGSLKGIETMTILDEKTVRFNLKEADSLFIGRLVIGIVPKKLIDIDHPFQLNPIGSGACEFVSLTEQKLVLKRRADHQFLEFIPVKDATVRVLKLKKGELDLVQNDLSPELVNFCDQQPELTVNWHNGTNFGYIGFNFEDPLLKQPVLRKAIAHGIDRQAIIDAMFEGNARLAGGLLVPEHWAGVKQMPAYEYNPEKARALVNQVVIENEGTSVKQYHSDGKRMLHLSYKTSNDPTRIRLATIYQAQLKKVGIHLDIQSFDWGTFYNDIKKGRFQLYSLAWVGVKSPDIFQYVFDSNATPPNGANRGRYANPLADQYIQQAGATLSLDEQSSLYQKLQTLLQKDLAAMPLWYEHQYLVCRKEVQGFKLYSDGRYDGILAVQRMRASA